MLEKEIIQENGFRNVRKNGQIAGFQVGYRSCYYRSVWLSMSLGFDVTVDGEKFSRDQITVTVGGKTYTQEEMKMIGDVQWSIAEAAILTVAKPGGLKPGLHEVEIGWGHAASYMPMEFGAMPRRPQSPNVDAAMRGMMPFTEKRKIVLVV
jgi:Domain of unknown function (DUF6379)